MIDILNFVSNGTVAIILSIISILASTFIAVSNFRTTKKQVMIQSYTAERLHDLHEIKKWANILLSEACLVTHVVNTNVDCVKRIERINGACNEFRFLLKPVYEIDKEVIGYAINLQDSLIEFYKDKDRNNNFEKYVKAINQAGIEFRRGAFLYAHSSWTCIKRQIHKGEFSEYKNFKKAYIEKRAQLASTMVCSDFCMKL